MSNLVDPSDQPFPETAPLKPELIQLGLTQKELDDLRNKILKCSHSFTLRGKLDLKDSPERLLIQLLTSLLVDQSAAMAAIIPYIVNSPIMAQLPAGLNLTDTYFFVVTMLHALYNKDYPVDKLETIKMGFGIFEHNFPTLKELFTSLPSIEVEHQIESYVPFFKVKDDTVQH